jgi:hypothetical protein
MRCPLVSACAFSSRARHHDPLEKADAPTRSVSLRRALVAQVITCEDCEHKGPGGRLVSLLALSDKLVLRLGRGYKDEAGGLHTLYHG